MKAGERGEKSRRRPWAPATGHFRCWAELSLFSGPVFHFPKVGTEVLKRDTRDYLPDPQAPSDLWGRGQRTKGMTTLELDIHTGFSDIGGAGRGRGQLRVGVLSAAGRGSCWPGAGEHLSPSHSGVGQEPADGHMTSEGTGSLRACNRGSTFLLKYPESCQASLPLAMWGRGGLGWSLSLCGLRSEEGNGLSGTTVVGGGPWAQCPQAGSGHGLF